MIAVTSETATALVLAHRDTNRELLVGLLEDQGLEAIGCADVEVAGQYLEEEDQLAFAIVDIGGFTAAVWDVCKELSEDGVPVVVLTGSRTETVQDATLRAGVHSVIEKPLRKANLVALVRSLRGRG